jgi:hypothetical protein
MFSYEKPWRSVPASSGVMLRISMENFDSREILLTGLTNPHSIILRNGKSYLCDSGAFAVRESGQVIFKTTGYLRGLDVSEKYIFAGQSTSRNTTFVRNEHLNISIDAGIHILHKEQKISTFLHLPATEVYGILAEEI